MVNTGQEEEEDEKEERGRVEKSKHTTKYN